MIRGLIFIIIIDIQILDLILIIIIYNDSIICYLNLLFKTKILLKNIFNISFYFLHFFILIFNFIKKKISFIII